MTPEPLAREMSALLLAGREAGPWEILDPCVGPGTFPAALQGQLGPGDRMTAIDIDPKMVNKAHSVVRRPSTVQLANYLNWRAPRQFDAVILNPPYIRQEWLDGKGALRETFKHRFEAEIPGTANAYVYFLVKALHDLRVGGKLVAVVYDSWRYTRYGAWLSAYLEQHSTDVEVLPVKRQPFDGRLIDATIIVAVRRAGRASPLRPATAEPQPEGPLRPLHEQYETRRGLRLKQSRFFLCEPKCVAELGATTFVKHIRFINGYAVRADHPQAALLVGAGEDRHPALDELRLRLGMARKSPDEFASILTWAKERPDVWYMHPEPPRAPILFNYYMRGRPRHLLNPGHAYADNFYGLFPRHDVPTLACLAALNSTAAATGLRGRARNQGGGLAKLQLFEYREAVVPAVHLMAPTSREKLIGLGRALTASEDTGQVIRAIDAVVDAELAGRRVPG